MLARIWTLSKFDFKFLSLKVSQIVKQEKKGFSLFLLHVQGMNNGHMKNDNLPFGTIDSKIEEVHGQRPLVTFDVRSNSPFVSQANTSQSGRRI